MAAKYKRIDPRIWNDEKFQQLSPTDKLVGLYIITGQSNRIGYFVFKLGACADDTGLPPETCRDAVERVCTAMGWKYDSTVRVIFLPTWWKYNKPHAEQTLFGTNGCLADLHDVPDCELLGEFVAATAEYVKAWGWDEAKLGLSLPSGYAQHGLSPPSGRVHNHNHEHEHKQEHETRNGLDSPAENAQPASVSPSPSVTAKVPSKAPRYPDWFEHVWSLYPERNGAKKGKKPAYAQCVKAGFPSDEEGREKLEIGVRNYADYVNSPEGPFPKDFERFVRDQIWWEFQEPVITQSRASPPAKRAPTLDDLYGNQETSSDG